MNFARSEKMPHHSIVVPSHDVGILDESLGPPRPDVLVMGGNHAAPREGAIIWWPVGQNKFRVRHRLVDFPKHLVDRPVDDRVKAGDAVGRAAVISPVGKHGVANECVAVVASVTDMRRSQPHRNERICQRVARSFSRTDAK
jgi:hypothetical protein